MTLLHGTLEHMLRHSRVSRHTCVTLVKFIKKIIKCRCHNITSIPNCHKENPRDKFATLLLDTLILMEQFLKV